MKRTLFVMRHSKSDWHTGEADHQRPLNGRGRRDGHAAGEYFASLDTSIDRALVSTSIRTRQTWSRILDGGGTAEKVTYHDEIYESTPADVLPLLQALPDDVAAALVIGHFPCVAQLVEMLGQDDGGIAWDEMRAKYRTSGIATLTFEGDWAGLDEDAAELREYYVPRGDA